MPDNFQRMMELVDETFDIKNDPGQLQVNSQVMKHLQLIHPATLTDHQDADGPIAWILLLPTLTTLREPFLKGEINEQALVDQTPVGAKYDTIYLCSATILPDHRRNGLGTTLVVDAIALIQQEHVINSLFYWAFTPEGDRLAEKVAQLTNLPLLRRNR